MVYLISVQQLGGPSANNIQMPTTVLLYGLPLNTQGGVKAKQKALYPLWYSVRVVDIQESQILFKKENHLQPLKDPKKILLLLDLLP